MLLFYSRRVFFEGYVDLESIKEMKESYSVKKGGEVSKSRISVNNDNLIIGTKLERLNFTPSTRIKQSTFKTLHSEGNEDEPGIPRTISSLSQDKVSKRLSTRPSEDLTSKRITIKNKKNTSTYKQKEEMTRQFFTEELPKAGCEDPSTLVEYLVQEYTSAEATAPPKVEFFRPRKYKMQYRKITSSTDLLHPRKTQEPPKPESVNQSPDMASITKIMHEADKIRKTLHRSVQSVQKASRNINKHYRTANKSLKTIKIII